MLTVFFIFGLFLLTTLGFNVARVCSSATTTLENERVFEALSTTTAANVCCQHDVTNDDNALPTPTMMKDAAAAPADMEDNTFAATAAAAAT